jgi:hypothetical protein
MDKFSGFTFRLEELIEVSLEKEKAGGWIVSY